VLVGSYGAGLFAANFFNHEEDRMETDVAGARAAAPELSTHNVNLEQFIHVPHALLSVVALGFMIAWLETARRFRVARHVVAALLVVAVLAGMFAARKAFPFVQRPLLADPDLRAAVGAIPVNGSLTATNVPHLSVVALHGHHFYDQKADYFNYRALQTAFLARRAAKARLLSPDVPDADKSVLLSTMGVTHLLLDNTGRAVRVVPGCAVLYENPFYRVCQVSSRAKR